MAEVVGYRAPSFAINDDILKIIANAGYLYDSSYNSFSLHGRYGKISLNGTGKLGIGHKLSDNFYELPISNLIVNGRFLPLGGGAYFRLIPVSLFNLGIKKIGWTHRVFFDLVLIDEINIRKTPCMLPDYLITIYENTVKGFIRRE